MADNFKYDVFLSHCSKDKLLVRVIAGRLRGDGLEVWFDEWQIKAGDNILARIEEGLEQSRVLVLCLSANAFGSDWAQLEASTFRFRDPLNKERRFIPLRLDESPIKGSLAQFLYINWLSEERDQEYAKLLEACRPRATTTFASSDTPLRPVIDPEAGRKCETAPETSVIWSEAVEAAHIYSEDKLQAKYKDKYNHNCYISRETLLRQYHQFLSSDKSVMVITGDAGTGKSNFVCGIAQERLENALLLLEDCASLRLHEGISVQEYIALHILGDVQPNIANHLSSLLNEDRGRRIVLIFDGINEATNIEKLLSQLSKLVNSIESDRLKLILTCRMPIWNVLKRHLSIPLGREYHLAGPDSYVSIEGFKDDEAVRAYEAYKITYKIKTEYGTLSKQVKQMISKPLFLRLTAECYRNKDIPSNLVLQDIFTKYLQHCIVGKLEGDDNEVIDISTTREFILLKRIVHLMYETAQKEIDYLTLRSDHIASQYLLDDETKFSPYTKLINEGLLSEHSKRDGLLKTTKTVFITYERMFEFLLAALEINSFSRENILKNLDIAFSKSFAQLQGAVELGLSFEIVSERSDVSSIVEIARLDRPDSRQFLCNVLQTIYDSGKRDTAERLVNLISHDTAKEARLLAVQAAYQLGLIDSLTSLSFSDDIFLRELSTLYLYQRWNHLRLNRRIADAYAIVDRLTSYITPGSFIHLHPTKSRGFKALRSLIGLSSYMLIHIVDDPDSIEPLIDIFRTIIRRTPGLNSLSATREGVSFTSDIASTLITKAVTLICKRIFINDEVLDHLYDDPKTMRALLDVGSLIMLPSLVDHEIEVKKIINWRHPMVSGSSRSVLTRHVYLKYELHYPFLRTLLTHSDLAIPVRINILHSLVFGMLARILQNIRTEGYDLQELADIFTNLWEEFSSTNSDLNAAYGSAESTTWILQNVLFGIALLEALKQRQAGLLRESEILLYLGNALPFNNKAGVDLLFVVIRKLMYQGQITFTLRTMLDRGFQNYWESLAPLGGLKLLANIRVIYQNEVDDALQDNEGATGILDKMRALGEFPDAKEFWEMGFKHWTMIGSGVNLAITKLAGLALLDMAITKNLDEFLERFVRNLVSVVMDKDVLNIMHVQYGLAHNPEWNLYDQFNISLDILERKPHVHAYYKEIAEQIVHLYGKGILYGEL